MSNKVYQVIRLVGTSSQGIEAAINNALEEANKQMHKVDWFEVKETRGFVDGGKVRYYQVNLDIGCVK